MDKMIYKKEAGKAQLVVEVPQEYEGEYEFSMLCCNEPEGFLPVSECSEGMIRRYYYDVTGCSCLADMMIRSRMDAEMIAQLVRDLCMTLDQAYEYLLDGGRIGLDPSYIYYRQRSFCFCYLPFEEPAFDWGVRRLAEFISDCADPEDRLAVSMADRLYEAASTFGIDRQKLQEIAEMKCEDEEPLAEQDPEPLVTEGDMTEEDFDLPWDEWHIESKPGLFHRP